MERMIIATVVLIVFIAVAIMTYSIVAMPLEYIIDALLDGFAAVGGETNNADSTLKSLPYFLAGSVIIAIGLMIVWFFAYAQKKEHEQW